MPPALVLLTDAPDDALGEAMDVARSVGGVGRVLLFRPPEAETELARRSLGFRLWPQDGDTPARRFSRAFEQAADLGYDGAIVIPAGGHVVGASCLARAVALLPEHAGVIAPMPCDDAAIGLLGLQEPHPTLFQGDDVPGYAEMINRATQQRVRLGEVAASPVGD